MDSLPPLFQRIGPDSIQQFEQAAIWRFEEGQQLRAGRPLAAIYLFGYSAEARLQAAVYRLGGLRPTDAIDTKGRQVFLKEARQLRLMTPEPHDIFGWCRYLDFCRKRTMSGFSAGFSRDLILNGKRLYQNWRPNLRYRTLAISGDELRDVLVAATWFKCNYNNLWS